MNKLDLKRLLGLLGPEGTRAGLLHSAISNRSLIALARRLGEEVASDEARERIVSRLVQKMEEARLLPLEKLMTMSFDDLEQHFAQVNPSSDELLKLMKQLDYRVSSADKKHLRRFAARQISETALFSSVAGRGRSD